jgi:hypothetical protein
MASRHVSTAPALTRFGLVLVVLGALQGCANLEAVREFGKTVAEVSSYRDAGKAYQKSARTIVPYLAGDPVQGNRAEARLAQVAAANAVQASLAGYFATLAKLAGEDSFSLDAELDVISKGLQSLPAGTVDPDAATNAIALAKTLQKYALARAQASAVKELVTKGGPPAMRLLTRLEAVATSWRGALENDSRTVVNTISALAAARDTPPLVSMLARDRQQQHQLNYDQAIKRVDTAIAALQKIRAAHEAMASNLEALDSKQLQSLLKGVVADLKAAKKNLP